METNSAKSSELSPRVVDAWAQPAFKHLFHRVPEISRLFAQSGATALLETGVTPDQMIQQMDATGVETVLLSAWHRPGGWVVTNDEVAAMCREFPGRF